MLSYTAWLGQKMLCNNSKRHKPAEMSLWRHTIFNVPLVLFSKKESKFNNRSLNQRFEHTLFAVNIVICTTCAGLKWFPSLWNIWYSLCASRLRRKCFMTLCQTVYAGSILRACVWSITNLIIINVGLSASGTRAHTYTHMHTMALRTVSLVIWEEGGDVSYEQISLSVPPILSSPASCGSHSHISLFGFSCFIFLPAMGHTRYTRVHVPLFSYLLLEC